MGKGKAIERVEFAAEVVAGGEDGWRGRGKGLQAELPIIAATARDSMRRLREAFFASLSQSN